MKRRLCALVLSITMLSTSLSVLAGDAPNPETEAKESALNYTQFLGNEGLQGVYDAKTPRTADELELKWKVHTTLSGGWNDTPGSPIVVGDYVYCYSSQYLHKYELKTGKEVASAQVFGKSTNQFMINLCYGDGKIFVPVKTNNMDDGTGVVKAHLRVFDADTLEQLYITDDAMATSDTQTAVMYHDGYVVTGGYGGKGFYVCYSTEDEDPTRGDEVKEAVWSIQTQDRAQSFSWNGAAFVGDFVYYTDKGRSPGPAIIYVVNYKTGDIAQQIELPQGYRCNSTVVYNDKNNRLYVPSNNNDGGASIRSYEIQPAGTLNEDEDTIKEWKSGTKGGGTQSTPVIYNDRLYIDGGGGTMGSSEPFHVVDANTMETIYTIDGLITKGSAAVSTAYATEENDHQVYIYMVPYNCNTDENFWIISDKQGQTEPDYETAKTVGNNYCSQTVAVAPNGYLVWYQDDGYLYVYGREDDAPVTGEDVNAQIARLADPADFGYYNKVEIARIHERYDALSDAEKEKVTEYEKLLEIDKVMLLDGKNAVERLNSGIAALPDTITLDNKDTVLTLRSIYNKLSEDERQAVVGMDKLESAEAAIAALETEQAITALVGNINALPSIDKLTSADGGNVKKLMEQYEPLKQDDREKVTNSALLLAAFERITAIEKQMADVEAMIKEKLEGVTVTLDTKEDIQAIDKAMEGLASTDVAKITAVEQFLSPAKVDLVNLMLKELVEDGQTVTATQENKEALQALLDEINQYYTGIPEADKKYVEGYEAVATVQAAIDALEEKDSDLNGGKPAPETGDHLPTAALLLVLAAGSTLLINRKRK